MSAIFLWFFADNPAQIRNLAISGCTRPISVQLVKPLIFFTFLRVYHSSPSSRACGKISTTQPNQRTWRCRLQFFWPVGDAVTEVPTDCGWMETRSCGAPASSSQPVAPDVLSPPHASKADEQHRRHAPACSLSFSLSLSLSLSLTPLRGGREICIHYVL